MYSDLISGLRLPSYDAFIVTQGTLEDPEKILYYIGNYSTVDGEQDLTLTTPTEFENAGYVHLATLHIDKVNETSVLIFVNPNKNSPLLDFHRNSVGN